MTWWRHDGVPSVGAMSSPTVPATRLTTAELAWLLSLRPGAAATLVATALGLPPDPVPDPAVPARLLAEGRAQERRGEVLPRDADLVVGDVLTGAEALVSVGTSDALVALLAVGRDRVLLVAPAPGGVEVAALAADVGVGETAAALAARVGCDAVVMVADGRGAIRTVPAGDGLAGRVAELLR